MRPGARRRLFSPARNGQVTGGNRPPALPTQQTGSLIICVIHLFIFCNDIIYLFLNFTKRNCSWLLAVKSAAQEIPPSVMLIVLLCTPAWWPQSQSSNLIFQTVKPGIILINHITSPSPHRDLLVTRPHQARAKRAKLNLDPGQLSWLRLDISDITQSPGTPGACHHWQDRRVTSDKMPGLICRIHHPCLRP